MIVLFEEGVVAVLADFSLLLFAAEDGVGKAVVVHETVSGFTLVADNHVAESEVLSAVQDSLSAISIFKQESFSTVDTVPFLILRKTPNNRLADTLSIFQKQPHLTSLTLPSSHIPGLTTRLSSLNQILTLAISRKVVVVDALGASRGSGISVASFDIVGSDTDTVDCGDGGGLADGGGSEGEGQKGGDDQEFHCVLFKIISSISMIG